MTTTTKSNVQVQTKSSRRLNDRQSESLAGWLMASPAIVLVLGFLIIPFLFAFVFAFTNQRLISPNPTEYVGLSNFQRLLTVKVLRLDPVTDEATGEPVLDEEGNYTYPCNGTIKMAKVKVLISDFINTTSPASNTQSVWPTLKEVHACRPSYWG